MTDYRFPNTWRHRFPVTNSMSGVVTPVPYRILKQEGFADDNVRQVTVTYLVMAHHLEILINWLVPPLTTFEGSPIPQRNNAPMPGDNTLHAVEVRWRAHNTDKPVDPYGSDSWNLSRNNLLQTDTPEIVAAHLVDTVKTTPTYAQVVEVDVLYDNKQKDTDPSDFLTWLELRITNSGEFLTIDAQEFAHWGTVSGKQPQTPIPGITKIIPMQEWTLTWKHIKRGDFVNKIKPRIDKYIGKVNSYPFHGPSNASPDRPGFEIPEACMMFVGYNLEEEAQEEIGNFFHELYTIEFKFLEKNIEISEPLPNEAPLVTHNIFFNKDDQKWMLLLVNGKSIYEGADLNRLFEFPWVDD